MNKNLEAYLSQFQPVQASVRAPDGRCGECFGRGVLTRLGGDWGKTPDAEVACWACNGTGESRRHL